MFTRTHVRWLRFSTLAMAVALTVTLPFLSLVPAVETQKREVHVKDIRDGNIVVVGLLGHPMYEMMTLRGVWRELPDPGETDLSDKSGMGLFVTHVNGRQLPAQVAFPTDFVDAVDRREQEVSGRVGDAWELRGYESCAFLGRPEEYRKELGYKARQQALGLAPRLNVIVTKTMREK